MQRPGAGRTAPSTAHTLQSGKGQGAKPASRPVPSASKPGVPGTAKPPTAVKRPGAFDGATSATRKPSAKIAIRVSTNEKVDEIGIQTLLGPYEEKGMNHGKKFFQKTQKIDGHEDVPVFLYYWDSRDGPDFCGWWFGDKVGGEQVWSRAKSDGELPPTTNWRIPWDSDPTKHLIVEHITGAVPTTRATSAPAVGRGGADRASESVTERVKAVESETMEILDNAKEMMDAEDCNEDTLAEAEGLLKAQLAVVRQAQTMLAQDIQDARMGGASQVRISALSKLSPRLRGLHQNLIQEISRAKGQLGKVHYKADEGKKKAESDERMAVSERRDAKALQEALPQVMELVTQAEDAVETVAILAASFSGEEEELGESEKKTMDEIEEKASKASTALLDARKMINSKLAEANKYAPEAKKVALQEFQALQSKVTEAGTKLNPLKKFRQEFEQRAAAKKSIEEITGKITNAEMEVEKAYIMTSAAADGQMSDDEIKSAEQLLSPAHTGIAEAKQLAERRSRAGGEAFKAELESIQERAKQASEKLDEIRGTIRRQKEGLAAQRMLSQAHEKLERAEEALTATTEAETPFLKVGDGLPQSEAMQAIKDSETAASTAETAVDLATTFIKAKIADAKIKYSKGLAARATSELEELKVRVDGLHTKLKEFKKETMRRKTQALLKEVVEKVAEAEGQVQTLAEVAKLLSSENLNEVSTENLKSVCEQTVIAEKDAKAACEAARTMLTKKQKEAREPSMVTELSKLQTRLHEANSELTEHRKAAANGDRLMKSKQVLIDEEDKIKLAELEVAKVETMATPLGDERPTDEHIQSIDSAVGVAQNKLNLVMKSIDAHIPNAMPQLKASLSKLLARAKKSQDKVEKVKALTREQRERVSSESYIKEAVKKTDLVDVALKLVNEAELPFLKGIEVLPLKEAVSTIANSESAAETVQKALSEARTYIASRTLEVRRFTDSIAKPTAQEFQKLTERINNAGQKLSQFRRDTDSRKRTALMTEAQEKLAAVEAEVQKTTEAAAPLATEDLDKLSAETATEICEKLAALEKAAQTKMDNARSFLAERQKDVKGHPSHEEQLKKLQGRLSGIQVELTKSKKAASEREQKFVAKKLLSEAGDMIGEVEGEIDKAVEMANPLVAEGGSPFLVANNVLLLVEAFNEQIQKNGTTKASLFEQLSGGSGGVNKGSFKTFLDKLPERFGREDITFSDEQKDAIFKQVDTDKSGQISKNNFDDMFRERYMCTHSISVTDTFEIGTSKTVTKLELDEVVEALEPPRVNEALGVTRLHCKLQESGKEGWVTMKGNQGTVYLEPFSPYASFVKALERVLELTTKKTAKAATFIKQKGAELASCSMGPLMEARGELSKLRPKVGSAQKKIDELKKKVVEAKKDYSKREEAEKRLQQEIRDRKTASAILSAIAEKADAMDVSAQRLEEALKLLTSAEGSALEAFAAPISALKSGDEVFSVLTADVSAVRACISKHQATIARPSKGPLHDAKQAVAKVMVKVDNTEKKGSVLLGAAKMACTKIASAAQAKAATAFREELQKRDISMETLFQEIAGKRQERIAEDVFCKRVSGLPGLGFSQEQAQLLFKHIEAGGISQRSFFRVLQQYYVCVKQIAVTNDFEISKSRTHRMLEVDEAVEVLEGPRGDEKLGVARIRGKALSDGITGWISVKGNQGTPFLKETVKPFLSCSMEVALERDFKSEGSSVIRSLRTDEVIEVLEGPRKDKVGDAVRIRARSCKDGTGGWLTVKDKEGVVNAETSGKYYVCTSPIAMTDVQDIKVCKVQRKLDVHEVLKVLEGPMTEEGKEGAGVSRVRGQAMKDGMTGWVTIKGNAGTIYAEESTKLYTIVKETPLQKRFPSTGSDKIRMLAKDEVVEILEGPKDEKFDALVRAKGRALSDGAVGWVTVRERALKTWTPFYKCTNATVIQDSLLVKGATTVRKLDVSEVVEVLEGPMVEKDLDVLRIRGRAEKDGTVGWVTLKGNQGTPFLVCRTK